MNTVLSVETFPSLGEGGASPSNLAAQNSRSQTFFSRPESLLHFVGTWGISCWAKSSLESCLLVLRLHLEFSLKELEDTSSMPETPRIGPAVWSYYTHGFRFSLATQPAIRCSTLPWCQLVLFAEPGAKLPGNICRWLALLGWGLHMFNSVWRCFSPDRKSSLALFFPHSIKQTCLHMLLIRSTFQRWTGPGVGFMELKCMLS